MAKLQLRVIFLIVLGTALATWRWERRSSGQHHALTGRVILSNGSSAILLDLPPPQPPPPPPPPPPHPPPPCQAANTRASTDAVSLLISVNINEDADWIKAFVEYTAEAIAINHTIVFSTNPDMYGPLQAAVNTSGHVYFSNPTHKHKWGYDLLRGHIANLKFAFRKNLTFTHAIVLASNAFWVRKVTPQWCGFTVPVPAPFACPWGFHDSVSAKINPNWHFKSIAEDDEFWEWVAKNQIKTLCAAPHEGVYGTREAFSQIINFLLRDDILNHNPPVNNDLCMGCGSGYRYPAEELIFGTLFHHLNLTNQTMGAGDIIWHPLAKYEFFDYECTNPAKLVLKRVVRDRNNPEVQYLRELWKQTL